MALTLVLTYMPALAFADGDDSWTLSAEETDLYLPEGGGSVTLNVTVEGEHGPLYYHWLAYDPVFEDDDYYRDENGDPVKVDNADEIEPITVSSPGIYHCQARDSSSAGSEGDWRTVRFNVYEAGGGESSDSWYIGNSDYVYVTYDPETDETVTLDGEVINGDDYNLTFKWVSIDYDEDVGTIETVLSGEDGMSVTVDAHPGEYRFVVTDAENDREEYVTFLVYEESQSGDDDSDVESIEYIPVDKIEIYENTLGYEYQRAEDTEPYWVYNEYHTVYAREGDRLHVVYKDGSEETFEYMYDVLEDTLCYVSEEGNYIFDGDLTLDDDQAEEGGNWEVGENYFYVWYEGVSCQVPVYIVQNPVTKIEYKFARGLEFTEHADGWFDDDDPDYFRYRFEWREGDVLTVYTTDDPDGKEYTLMEAITGGGQELWYEAEDGSIIDSDKVSITDNQEEEHWQVGNSYDVTVTYAGRTFTAKATVKEQVLTYLSPQEYLLSDPLYIYKDNNVSVQIPEGSDFREFEITDVTSSDSRVKVKEYSGEGFWIVTATEKGTYSLDVTHTTIDPLTGDVTGEITEPMEVTFTDESVSVDVTRLDSTISNHEVLPGQTVKAKAQGYYYKVIKDSDGNFDSKEITSNLTYKWVLCDEKNSAYVTMTGADTNSVSIAISKNIDPKVLRRGIEIGVKAELYYNGVKKGESEELNFEVRNHYFAIEPETFNSYLVPNTKTKFAPKLYKYAFADGAITKTDTKAEFDLDYDSSEFKVTDANGKAVSDYAKGPFYITRLTNNECILDITGSGEGTPSIGHNYTFDYMVNIKNAKVSGIANKTYNGKAQTQKPTIKVYDREEGRYVTLSASKYTIAYKNNKNVGKAYVYIKGKGKYYGSVPTQAFKINPLGTYLTKRTPVSKGFTVKWARRTTKMSTSVINGYQIQYSTSSKFTSGNKLVTVKGYKSYYKKITGLTGKKRYYIRIRTYKTVGGVNYYSPWSTRYYLTTKA